MEGYRKIKSKIGAIGSDFSNRLDPRIPKYIRKIMSVEGSINPREAGILYLLASKVMKGVIVEIGSFRGRSTVALSLGSKAGKKVPVYAIEPHEEFKGVLGGEFGPKDRISFFKNMLKNDVCDIVRLVNLDSETASKGWNKKIGLLWIDGDHRYKAVKNDYKCWENHLVPGGILAFHDADDPNLGPMKVVQELIRTKKFEKVLSKERIMALKKLA